MTAFRYPAGPRADIVENLHGKEIADPFRPLEDPHTEATKEWIAAENDVTRAYLNSIPARTKINARLNEIWDYERRGVPTTHGDCTFFLQNDGMQNQPTLYKQAADGSITTLIDPNDLSADGTVAMNAFEVSPNGKLIGYILSKSGSDWSEIRIRNIETGEDLEDRVEYVKFSNLSWRDDASFYYSRYDKPNEKTKHEDIDLFQKLYLHKIGAPQSKDPLVFERADDGQVGLGGHVTGDRNYLIIMGYRGTNRETIAYIQDLSTPGQEVRPLIEKWESLYHFIGSDGDTIFFRTDNGASRYRIVGIDAKTGDLKEIIAEAAGTIETAAFGRGRFLVHYLNDAASNAQIFLRNGTKERELDLPGLGALKGLLVTDPQAQHVYYSFENVIRPPEVYKYNIETGANDLYFKSTLKYNPDDFEVLQEFYKSKDGTQVPMFITRKKGLKNSGNNPTLLYGYGGFNVSLQPFYRLSIVTWLEMGGVYAMANLRGGGEYGETWYKAGIRAQKQNVFDDFIAGAEHLIAQKYTSPEKLAIQGGSNGGLLVGACMTQRPDLFRAALPAVGVLDMLRFHKFTVGWAWASDFGHPDEPEDFRHLLAYSPLHNLKDGTTYPATLITTADHDDRVVPAHSFKFAARLQEAHAGDRPVLIRIDVKAGHGMGKPTAKVIEEQTDIYAFLVRELAMEV